jgi:hypothetical protein
VQKLKENYCFFARPGVSAGLRSVRLTASRQDDMKPLTRPKETGRMSDFKLGLLERGWLRLFLP